MAFPHFSTDLTAAWLIVEKMGHYAKLVYGGDGSFVTDDEGIKEWIPRKEWEATFFPWAFSDDHERTYATGKGGTAPIAICRAALAVITPESGSMLQAANSTGRSPNGGAE